MHFIKSAYFLLFLLCILISPSVSQAEETYLRTYESEALDSAKLNLAILVGSVEVREWNLDYVKINSAMPSASNSRAFFQRGELVSFADSRLTPGTSRGFYRLELEVFVPSGTELIISGYDIDIDIAGGIEKLIADVSDLKLSSDGGLSLIDIDAINFEGLLSRASGVLKLKSDHLKIKISDSIFEHLSLNANSIQLDIDSTSASHFELTAATGDVTMVLDQVGSASVEIDRGDIAVTLSGSLSDIFTIDSKLGNIYLSMENHLLDLIGLSAESFNLINVLGDANLLESIDFSDNRNYAHKEASSDNSPKIEARTARGRIDIQLTNRAD